MRLSLRSLRQGIITLPIDIHAGNTAKVLFLSLEDETGRMATWIYDLPTTSQDTLRPRDGATLERPNVPPADGHPLDLGRIGKWELTGDPASDALLSVEIRGIVIEGMRVAD